MCAHGTVIGERRFLSSPASTGAAQRPAATGAIESQSQLHRGKKEEGKERRLWPYLKAAKQQFFNVVLATLSIVMAVKLVEGKVRSVFLRIRLLSSFTALTCSVAISHHWYVHMIFRDICTHHTFLENNFVYDRLLLYCDGWIVDVQPHTAVSPALYGRRMQDDAQLDGGMIRCTTPGLPLWGEGSIAGEESLLELPERRARERGRESPCTAVVAVVHETTSIV